MNMVSTTEQALSTQPEMRVSTTDTLNKLITNPATGASIAGAVVLGAAALFGAFRTAIAAGLAYGAYRYLEDRRHEQRRADQAS
jgi:hypothetical protein